MSPQTFCGSVSIDNPYILGTWRVVLLLRVRRPSSGIDQPRKKDPIGCAVHDIPLPNLPALSVRSFLLSVFCRPG